MRSTLLLCILATVGGCGDSGARGYAALDAGTAADGATSPDLAPAGAGDLATLPDLLASASDGGGADPADPGVQCKEATCPMDQVCCVDPNAMSASCQTLKGCAASPFGCDGPEDCGGNTPFCCATMVLGGSGINCTFMSAHAECKASCPTALGLCPATDVVKLCHKSADCAADPANPNCCILSNGGGAGIIACISDAVKTFTQATCM